MISTAKHKSGSSGACLGYMLGGKLKKDQQVRVVAYEGFALSRLKIAEIERIPSTREEKTEHKKALWEIANNLSKVFDARAALADYRVNDPLEDYVVSFVNDERARLKRKPTKEEREQYGLPELKKGETDERPLERIVLEEFLAEIGVHGEIEKRLRRKGKDGKKETVTQIVHREAMFLAVAHDGTAHPHIHVLTARPDANGVVNDTRNERRRILATVKKLSKKYNLSMKLEDYEVDLEKTNEGYATRILARDNALWALETATSHEELASILNEGVTGVIPSWKVHAKTGKEYGILFTKIDKHGIEHTWSGSQLDRELSYSKVEAALARNLAARQKAEAEANAAAEKADEEAHIAAEEAARQEREDIIEGYRSAVLPVGKQLYGLKKSAYELYMEAKDSCIGVCAATETVRKQLVETWRQNDEFNRQNREAKDQTDKVTAICGILTCLNPIVGLTAMFLASIVGDIHRASLMAQKKKLLAKVNYLRGELTALEEEKAALTIQKQERLQQYLDAKRMYQEYRDSLQTVDREIKAIKADIEAGEKKDVVRRYMNSDQANELLAYINGRFEETHYNLVSGPLVETDKGMRWVLHTDGFRSTSGVLYHQHAPAPQDHGESYIDFSFDENGHLIADIECDPSNYYTYGISGKLNLRTAEGAVTRRDFRGSREDEKARKQKSKDTYDKFQGSKKKPGEKKTNKNNGPSW